MANGVRSCSERVNDEPCPYPAHRRVQRCVFHWLLRQPAYTQTTFAQSRRSDVPETSYRSRVPEREWPKGERFCSGCQSFVPLFYCRGSRCVACASKASHASQVEKTFDLAPGEYDVLLERQGGVCAICKGRPKSKRLAVDHDHQTGAVRGLLCSRCNHDGLGAFHDSALLLWRALAYLLMPPAQFNARQRTRESLLERLGQALVAAAPVKIKDDEPAPF